MMITLDKPLSAVVTDLIETVHRLEAVEPNIKGEDKRYLFLFVAEDLLTFIQQDIIQLHSLVEELENAEDKK